MNENDYVLQSIDEFINKYGSYAFLDSIKLSLYKTGHKVIEESALSDLERETADWLTNNVENKLKDFFLADLSWANNQEERQKAFVDFFTKRTGKRVLEILPDNIKNYVLANSI